MLLPSPALQAQASGSADASQESVETRTQATRSNGENHREVPTGEQQSGHSQPGNGRTAQRWHGFLPGMFR
ncbi:hypothetical protein CO614_03880 [Lysobacteraceae bacterium NML120232]|nr:hypothetical protein CO614_03880 [Xanthomonadaceae bacterium NML120232]